MRAMVYSAPLTLEMQDVAEPSPTAGELVVEVAAAGICGSDLHYYRGEDPWGSARWPQRIGHELAGVVAAVGLGVGRVAPGQRVAIEPRHLLGCGDCRFCRRGDYHLCPRRGIQGGERRASAGFSEYDVAPAENVFLLPDHLSLEAAALADVYACAVHALHRAPLRPTDTVVVFGTGPVGLAVGQVARLAGARQILLVGRRDEALDLAVRAGAADHGINSRREDPAEAVLARTDGQGAEVVFEAVGGAEGALAPAVTAAARGGTIVLLGAFVGDVAVPYREANRRELDLRWSSSYSTWNGVRELQIALDLIAEERVATAPLLTHRFPLTEIAQAFQAANDKGTSGAVKVLIQPRPGRSGGSSAAILTWRATRTWARWSRWGRASTRAGAADGWTAMARTRPT
jgi:2-desacetyl-2-hydroxyethyl bacteriochlorophyllide A dehydrogenase